MLWINNSIRKDFNWAIKILARSSGVRLLKSLSWDLTEATHTIFCDACPEGMGFWYPSKKTAFFSHTPQYENPDLIFYFEALCVLCALFDAHRQTERGGKFIIYTDNLNTVDIYNTLRALPPYNHLLCASMDIIMAGDHDI